MAKKVVDSLSWETSKHIGRTSSLGGRIFTFDREYLGNRTEGQGIKKILLHLSFGITRSVGIQFELCRSVHRKCNIHHTSSARHFHIITVTVRCLMDSTAIHRLAHCLTNHILSHPDMEVQ
ncbi:hypothetical protein ACTXT7_013680 [Hymenolepis weldensis]